MADLKISQLTALTAANVAAADVLPIVDTSATTTKKVSALDVAEYVSTTTAITNLVSPKADLASPALTGTPTAPTASNGTSSTQIATTAFVINQSQNDQFVLAAAIFTS